VAERCIELWLKIDGFGWLGGWIIRGSHSLIFWRVCRQSREPWEEIQSEAQLQSTRGSATYPCPLFANCVHRQTQGEVVVLAVGSFYERGLRRRSPGRVGIRMKQMATLGRLEGGVLTKERLLLPLRSLSREGVASSEQARRVKLPAHEMHWGRLGLLGVPHRYASDG